MNARAQQSIIGSILITMAVGFILVIVIGVQHETDNRDRVKTIYERIEDLERKVDTLQHMVDSITSLSPRLDTGLIWFTPESDQVLSAGPGDIWFNTESESLTIQGDTSHHVYKRTGHPMQWRCIDHGDTILFDPHMKLSNL